MLLNPFNRNHTSFVFRLSCVKERDLVRIKVFHGEEACVDFGPLITDCQNQNPSGHMGSGAHIYIYIYIGPNSFIFMQFSAKNLQNNRLGHPARELAHSQEILDPLLKIKMTKKIPRNICDKRQYLYITWISQISFWVQQKFYWSPHVQSQEISNNGGKIRCSYTSTVYLGFILGNTSMSLMTQVH